MEWAASPGLSLLEQRALAEDPSDLVRELLAESDDLAPDVQLVLARDVATEVRRVLSTNSSLTAKAASLLASDPNPWVRSGLARNTSRCDRPTLLLLADDEDLDVGYHLRFSLKADQLDAGFPFALLSRVPAGVVLVEEVRSSPQTDASAWEALASTWAHSLDSLALACQTFST